MHLSLWESRVPYDTMGTLQILLCANVRIRQGQDACKRRTTAPKVAYPPGRRLRVDSSYFRDVI